MATNSIEHYRYERKFDIPLISLHEVHRCIAMNSAHFTELYPPRFINNMYFDTPSRQYYQANINGQNSRKKFRLRWYTNFWEKEMTDPVFEIKIKQNQTNRKELFPLPSLPITGSTAHDFLQTVTMSDIPDTVHHFIRCLEPSLINRYHRSYLQSADGKFRLTIDSNIAYVSPHDNLRSVTVNPVSKIIVEIKYAIPFDTEAGKYLAEFPFRLTKHSKYTSGVDYIQSTSLLP